MRLPGSVVFSSFRSPPPPAFCSAATRTLQALPITPSPARTGTSCPARLQARPITPSPARTGTSRPARPARPVRSVDRPDPTRGAAGPAGTTRLRVSPSGSGCCGMLIPAGGATGSPGTSMHTAPPPPPPPPPPHYAAVTGELVRPLASFPAHWPGLLRLCGRGGALLALLSARMPCGRGAAASRPAGRSVPMTTARHAGLSVRKWFRPRLGRVCRPAGRERLPSPRVSPPTPRLASAKRLLFLSRPGPRDSDALRGRAPSACIASLLHQRWSSRRGPKIPMH